MIDVIMLIFMIDMLYLGYFEIWLVWKKKFVNIKLKWVIVILKILFYFGFVCFVFYIMYVLRKDKLK